MRRHLLALTVAEALVLSDTAEGPITSRPEHNRGTLPTGVLFAVVAALAWGVLVGQASGYTLVPAALRISPPSSMPTSTVGGAARGPPTLCPTDAFWPSGEPVVCGDPAPVQSAISGPLAAIEFTLLSVLPLASFLVTWGLVVLAVVLPGMVPVLAAYGAAHGTTPGARRPALHALLFVLPALGLWLLTGVLVLAASAVVRAAAAASPALTAFLPNAPALGLGAVALIRLSPLHEGALRASRRSAALWAGRAVPGWRGTLAVGWAHGIASLGMGAGLVGGLVLGAAALPWALAVALLLFAERTLPRGDRSTQAAGALLLALALFALAWPAPALAALRGTFAPPWTAVESDEDFPPLPLLRTLDGHTGAVTAIAFSFDGALLASASVDGTVRLWDTSTGRSVRLLRHEGLRAGGDATPLAVAFSRAGGMVAIARSDGTVGVWDTATARQLPGPPKRGARASGIAFGPRDAGAAIGYADGEVLQWDLVRDRALRVLPSREAVARTVAFAPDGRTLATGGWSVPLTLWDTATGRALRTLPVGTAVWGVGFSPDGRLLAAAVKDGVVLWDAATGVVVRTLRAGPTTAVGFSPDGAVLSSVEVDGLVRAWEVATGRPLGAARIPGSVALVAIAPRRMVVATTRVVPPDSDPGYGTVVKLWDARPTRSP